MDFGNFPDGMYFAIGKHLHKKEDAEYIQNYRPISLVSVLRIGGKVIYTRLFFFNKKVIFLQKLKMVSDLENQRAIRDFLEPIQMAISEKITLLVILFELPKAYDELDHKIMLS